jgi:hypothetical protein
VRLEPVPHSSLAAVPIPGEIIEMGWPAPVDDAAGSTKPAGIESGQ